MPGSPGHTLNENGHPVCLGAFPPMNHETDHALDEKCHPVCLNALPHTNHEMDDLLHKILSAREKTKQQQTQPDNWLFRCDSPKTNELNRNKTKR